MPSVVTPARLTAAAGVLTGLAAAATSLTGIFTVGSHVGNAIVAAAGLLTTGATVFKFLDGQSNWDTALVHAASFGNAGSIPLPPGANPVAPVGDPVIAPGAGFVMSSPPEPDAPKAEDVSFEPDPTILDEPAPAATPEAQTAVLPGEEPVDTAPEPDRLNAQVGGS